jgi:hypothetical protein
MFLRLVCLVLLAFSFLTGSAQAQEYASISWANLMRTLVRFNALDLSDQNLLDEYAIITECDLYKSYYKDDFKWNQVRKAIRDSVQMNLAAYPTNYSHDLTSRLDRYDFEAKLFRFDGESSLRGVNTFLLYSVKGTGCGDAKVSLLPRTFRAVLSMPLYLDGLPLSEGDAKALLSRMTKDNNPDRLIFARYNFRTVYIEPLHRKAEMGKAASGKTQYTQTNSSSSDEVRFDVQLDSIGFYEDPQRTKLIYSYMP